MGLTNFYEFVTDGVCAWLQKEASDGVSLGKS